MNDLRTAAQQALEALYQAREHVTVHTDGPWQRVENDCHVAITALRAALAQPPQDHFPDATKMVQEPVANRAFLERILTAMEGVIDVADRKTDEFDALRSCVVDLTMMLHTAPPQRKPLSEEEIQAAWDSVDMRHPRGNETRIAFARAVERAHGIGGQP